MTSQLTTRLRPLAEADVVERSRTYHTQAGQDVAARFFDSAVAALRAIEGMPGAGSPRVGELCAIPGLRVRRIPGFPCGWYDFVNGDVADIVRLLADAQDLQTILGSEDEEAPFE